VKETKALSEPLADFVTRITPQWVRPDHLAPVSSAFERAARGEPVRICISVPPQHGKTELVLHAIARMLAIEPENTIAYVSYAAEQAESKSAIARDYALSGGVQLQDDFNTRAEWRTTDGGGLLATGIGGKLTGQGAKGLVVDDPFKSRDDAESQLMRDRAAGWLTSTGTTRIPEDGWIIIIHTRWHPDDLIGRCQSGKLGDWEIINIPALADESGAASIDGTRVLWPQQRTPTGKTVGWTREGLRARLLAVGPYDAWSLYLGKPRPKGGHVFGKGDVEPARFEWKEDGRPDLTDARIILSVDPAGTEKTTADYSVAVALAVRGHGETMSADLIDVLRYQLEPQQFAPLLYAFQVKWGNAKLVIEATRDGKALEKALKKIQSKLRFRLVPPRGDKFLRAQPVAAAYNTGRFRLPTRAEWLLDVLHEFGLFTGLGDAHDDIVDACSQGWSAADGAVTAGASVSDFQD
jgi:predicted phage terminase large subunit-like protein